jgi:outer membrane protein insertion porin family
VDLSDFDGSRGFIDASIVAANIPSWRILRWRCLSVDEVSKSMLRRSKPGGNSKTKDKVIRRELAITPGENVRMTRVNLSKSVWRV